MSNGQRRRYRLDYDTRAKRQLDRVNRGDLGQIRDRINALTANPRPARSLQMRDGSLRIRWGNWRTFYLVDNAERVIVITDVLRRNERTYRDR